MNEHTFLKFDHIAVFARTLEEGSAHIKDMLGIEMPGGGRHPRMGTHNQLLSLGNDCFMEVITIDPEAASPGRPRWFDLDRFDGPPVLGTWVVGTNDIKSALPHAHPDIGRATEITRGDLKWQISIADDGLMPLDGAFPAFIEWPEGEHPASRMVDLGCRLRSLIVEHPMAEEIENLIGNQIDCNLVQIQTGPTKKITAEIETPKGMRLLT